MKRDALIPGRAFTLIELLVVVAIIVALLAILMPSMGRAIEVANRAVCASNQRQLGLTGLNYATDHVGMFPDSTRPDGRQTTWHMHPDQRDLLMDRYGMLYKSFSCPNVADLEWWVGEQNVPGGFRMGLQRMWGMSIPNWTNSGPTPWVSPLNLSTPGADPEITADITAKDVAFPPVTIGAHTYGGFAVGADGILLEPDEIGIEGANVGLIDGSVGWRDVNDLREHRQYSAGLTHRGYW